MAWTWGWQRRVGRAVRHCPHQAPRRSTCMPKVGARLERLARCQVPAQRHAGRCVSRHVGMLAREGCVCTRHGRVHVAARPCAECQPSPGRRHRRLRELVGGLSRGAPTDDRPSRPTGKAVPSNALLEAGHGECLPTSVGRAWPHGRSGLSDRRCRRSGPCPPPSMPLYVEIWTASEIRQPDLHNRLRRLRRDLLASHTSCWRNRPPSG